jgi:hypothetical protein
VASDNEAYSVIRDPNYPEKWTIGVRLTGRPARGARPYDTKGEAEAACAAKNHATAHKHKGGRR